jgi:Cdc6-like AAA superfamily ATPase
MIEDATALAEGELPRRIVCRNAERQRLATAVEPVVDGERPETAFLFGPSGAGKTTVAKMTIRDLERTHLDIDCHYIHCRDRTTFALLSEIAEAVGVIGPTQPTSTDALRSALADADPYHIVVVDEADQLQDRSVLTDLYNTRSLSMVGIANDEVSLFADLDAQTSSRLSSSVTIRFDSYSETELVEILADRVEWGVASGAVRRPQLRQIARAADGDARQALAILRRCCRLADRGGHDELGDDLLDAETFAAAKTDLRQRQLDRLDEHHQAVFDVIDAYAEVTLDDVYDGYRDAVRDPRTQRRVSDYISKLVSYDLVRRLGPPQNRRFVTTDA